jgi:predicted molibdopterin-dependent oxidoreductase YjgC
MRETDRSCRVAPAGGMAAGFTDAEAGKESMRCMHCDCRKPLSCRLRAYAREYGARQARYKPTERRAFEHIVSHPDIVLEQGKCISCGICIRVAREQGEALGLSFVGRGMATRVRVPFDESLVQGLRKSAGACAEACPTGALAFRGGEDDRLARGPV